MAQTAGRFEHTAQGEAETPQRGINRLDDHGCGVMGVEGGGAGRIEFIRREQRFESSTLLSPLLVPGIENLWQSPPTDETHQHALLRLARRARFGLQLLEQLDGGQVVPALLLQRASAKLVLLGDAVVALVARRLWLGGGNGSGVWFYSSGARKR